MAISDDIKLVYEEIGSAFTIYRDAGNISGEYMDLEGNTQATKPITRTFFKEFFVKSDSAIQVGDIIEVDQIGERHLVMNIDRDMFENDVIEKFGVLYAVNVSGELLRPSGEVWNSQTYQKETVWGTVQNPAYGSMNEPLFGEYLQEQGFGLVQLDKQYLFTPSHYAIEVGDRYYPRSGEYYRVDSVLSRRYAGGVDLCILEEDNR